MSDVSRFAVITSSHSRPATISRSSQSWISPSRLSTVKLLFKLLRYLSSLWEYPQNTFSGLLAVLFTVPTQYLTQLVLLLTRLPRRFLL